MLPLFRLWMRYFKALMEHAYHGAPKPRFPPSLRRCYPYFCLCFGLLMLLIYWQFFQSYWSFSITQLQPDSPHVQNPLHLDILSGKNAFPLHNLILVAGNKSIQHFKDIKSHEYFFSSRESWSGRNN